MAMETEEEMGALEESLGKEDISGPSQQQRQFENDNKFLAELAAVSCFLTSRCTLPRLRRPHLKHQELCLY